MGRPPRHAHGKPVFRKAKRHHRPSARSDRIKPGADVRLKKVLQSIGTPAPTAFVPDSYQLEALAAIAESDCLVTAPTGAGKTWIAVKAIERIVQQSGTAWYASPLKALSNAKYAEFSDIFGRSQVGILTGDRKENPDGAVTVGTTEILRNQLYDAMHRGENLHTDLVVLDEAHFLGDPDRGVVWEEIMIYLPPRIPLLLLSATIGNAHDIAAWLASIRSRPCAVVEETRRPVPLYPVFFNPSGVLQPLLAPHQPGKRAKIYKKVLNHVNMRRPPSLTIGNRLPPFGDIIRTLRKYDLLPAIFFLKSRADCDRALELCRDSGFEDQPRKQQIGNSVAHMTRRFPHLADHRQRWALKKMGVAAHHSGQLPGWKLLIESLMSQGLLDSVFATTTVAAGVNFPARTVAFLNSDRFNGVEFNPLTPTEFLQMTGRAGRRGMDNIGFALVIPGRFMDVRMVAQLFQAPPSDVASQIKINFSMVLNLLLSHSPEEIEDLLTRSFANFAHQHRRRRATHGMQRHLWQEFMHHLHFLQQEGYVTADGRLTDDGRWASQLRVDQPLIFAEGFRRRVFPIADPALLAAVVGACVWEREVDQTIAETPLPENLKAALMSFEKGLQPFLRRMRKGGFQTRPLAPRPAAAVFGWASGAQWDESVSTAGLEEGILASLILRTADNLRHIRSLQHPFPQAAATAGRAVDLLLRDPVLVYF